MYWNKVCVKTNEELADIVSSALMDAGAGGVEIEGGAAIPVMHDELRPDIAASDTVNVIAYFGEDGFDEALRQINESLETIKHSGETGILELSAQSIPDTDWNENFKKHFTAFRAAGNIVVKPSWEDYGAKDGEVVIEIDPGMAFGSGVHETTKMCLELIQKHMQKGASVLDVGCGSGILGIACAKLGAGKVLALDNDSVSVKVAADNAKANGADIMEVRKSDLLSDAGGGKYDIVLANIVADIIIRLNTNVSEYMKPDAVYIISGIIEDRLGDVLKSLEENGFITVETLAMADWRAIAVRQKGDKR